LLKSAGILILKRSGRGAAVEGEAWLRLEYIQYEREHFAVAAGVVSGKPEPA